FVLNGKCLSAKDALPASIQLSSTSGTLRANSPQFSHLIVTSSISGLCKSVIFSPDKASNSAIDPGTYLLPHSHSHTGTGEPQYREREIFQSGACSMLLRKRPYLK